MQGEKNSRKSKGINVKKNNSFKIIKIKIRKREKKKRRKNKKKRKKKEKKKTKKENSTDLQKLNIKPEV